MLTGKICFGGDTGTRSYLYVIQSISLFGTFLVPALLFSYFATKKWFSYNEADKIAPPSMVGYVVILSLFILPIIACLGYFNEQIALPESMQKIEIWMREMEESSKQIIEILTANSNIFILLANIVIMALFPAIFEEFLFRGTLQPFFTKWFTNKHVAIIVTAFIFSAVHFQFYGFIPRFLLGIYLGYLFVWGRSLWLPIIAHFMHNANSVILDYCTQRRGIDMEAIDPSQIPGFYWVVLGCVVCVGVGGWRLWRKGSTDCTD
jgi:membrane protease YdiL (CAAX protease family)